MAVYRIFPESDSFIYTENIQGNAGRDEILEIGGYPVSAVGQTSRTIVKFSTFDIQDTLNSKVGTSSFDAFLHLSLASAYELPQSYSLYSYPVYDDWTNGVGKFGDIPINKSGCSWKNRLAGTNHPWTTVSQQITTTSELGFTLNNNELHTTSSFEATLTGGGSWYFTSGSAPTILSGSQSFNKNSVISSLTKFK